MVSLLNGIKQSSLEEDNLPALPQNNRALTRKDELNLDKFEKLGIETENPTYMQLDIEPKKIKDRQKPASIFLKSDYANLTEFLQKGWNNLAKTLSARNMLIQKQLFDHILQSYNQLCTMNETTFHLTIENQYALLANTFNVLDMITVAASKDLDICFDAECCNGQVYSSISVHKAVTNNTDVNATDFHELTNQTTFQQQQQQESYQNSNQEEIDLADGFGMSNYTKFEQEYKFEGGKVKVLLISMDLPFNKRLKVTLMGMASSAQSILVDKYKLVDVEVEVDLGWIF